MRVTAGEMDLEAAARSRPHPRKEHPVSEVVVLIGTGSSARAIARWVGPSAVLRDHWGET